MKGADAIGVVPFAGRQAKHERSFGLEVVRVEVDGLMTVISM